MNRVFLTLFMIILCLAISLSFVAMYRGYTIKEQKKQIHNLSANIELLINRSKKDYADKEELAKRNEILGQLAKQETSCFTWTTDISNSSIVMQLRKN